MKIIFLLTVITFFGTLWPSTVSGEDVLVIPPKNPSKKLCKAKVFFQRFFDYIQKALENEEFSDEFFKRLIEMFKDEESKFSELIDRLMEYIREMEQQQGRRCGFSIRTFFQKLFERLFQDYEKEEDEELELYLDREEDENVAETIGSFKPKKLFKKLFETFFEKIKDDAFKNGLDSESLLEIVQRIFEFYQMFQEDENGEGAAGIQDFLRILFDLLSGGSERRIIRKDCLPIEINDEEVKCKKKGSKTKCKIKKKNKIGENGKGKEKYSYKEESKVIEGLAWDDLTDKQREGKEKRDSKIDGPDKKGKVVHKEKNKFEGYQQVTTDEGENAVLKYKVKCKYYKKSTDFSDEFADVVSGRPKDGVDEFDFFHSFFSFIGGGCEGGKGKGKGGGGNCGCGRWDDHEEKEDEEFYIPQTVHQYDLMMDTLSSHLSVNEKVDDDEEDTIPLDEEEEKEEDEENENEDSKTFGLIEIYGADVTVSVIILSILLLFILAAVCSLVGCTCCFLYFFCREKWKALKKWEKKKSGEEEGYKRLSELDEK